MKPNLVHVAAAMLALAGPVRSASAGKSPKATVNLITADGVGKAIGTITIKASKDGVTIEPKLKDLPPGEHGFHMHEKGSCDPADKEFFF